MALFAFDSGADTSWLNDIDFDFGAIQFTPTTPTAPVIPPAPVVQQPVVTQPVVQTPPVNIPIAQIGPNAGAPAPVLPPTNNITPIAQIGPNAGAPAPVLPPTNNITPIQSLPGPTPVVQQPVVQTPPAPSPLQILEQQQSVGMAPVNVPQPMVSTPRPAPVAPRPIPQVTMPKLSPQEQALFNRNIPASGPVKQPVATARPMTQPVRQPVPMQPARQPIVARQSTLAPRMATQKEITIQKPMVSREDTYKGPVVKSQGRLTPQQAQRIVK